MADVKAAFVVGEQCRQDEGGHNRGETLRLYMYRNLVVGADVFCQKRAMVEMLSSKSGDVSFCQEVSPREDLRAG